MALRDQLLDLLERAFPDERDLFDFARGHRPSLTPSFAPSVEANRPPKARPLLDRLVEPPRWQRLAEHLVDDALQHQRVDQLLAAVRKARPGMDAQLVEAKQAVSPVPLRTAGPGITLGWTPGDKKAPERTSFSTTELHRRGELDAGGRAGAENRKVGSIPPSQSGSTGEELDEDFGATELGSSRSPDDDVLSEREVVAAVSSTPPLDQLTFESLPVPRPLVEPQRVSMGFAAPEEPDAPIVDRTLAASRRYLLWVEIGPELAAGSLPDAAPLRGLHEDDVLDVIIFPFPDQLALEGPRHGRIQIDAGGNQVVQPAWQEHPTAAHHRRLCFAFRTPEKPGSHALRCNIYCRGVLLQSHLVRARISKRAQEHAGALSRVLDYNLSSSLDSARIPSAGDCRISLFINDDGHGTHSFRFVSSKHGVPEYIGDGHVEGAQLAKMVQYARRALRWAAWGSEEPWTPGQPCKFSSNLEEEKLSAALILMARRGANLWMQLSAEFSFVGPTAMELREHMRAPGRVQIALKDSPDAVIPIALVYDYPFDAARSKVSVCKTAMAALAAGAAALAASKPLADEPCFRGDCPAYGDRSVVCPGGFWGFRHDLGLPLHLPRGEVATTIPRGEAVRAFAPISTDAAFVLRDGHLERLAELAPSWLEILRDRESCLARLKEARQLVYFYCHGGVTPSETPFLRVGELQSDDIFAETLVDAGISWPPPLRPLVFLNGCHTTATSPDAMFSMLTAFATHCNAAGIIGTEITNFELIAGTFAHEFLRNFLAGEQLGRSVRLGRLALLGMGNPLGLMYIPFALPGLHLE